jgi:ribosomal protein S18 acetylase RimI-like enzyme
MADRLTIRSAVPGDAPDLAILSGALGYPVVDETLAQRLRNLLTRAEDIVLVAEVAPSRIVGWLHGAEQELLESGRRCEILGLVVDGRYRGQGVGRQLVDAVEEWAAKRGLEHVVVRSNVVRTEAHPFYERLGYMRAKTQHAYRKQLTADGAV